MRWLHTLAARVADNRYRRVRFTICALAAATAAAATILLEAGQAVVPAASIIGQLPVSAPLLSPAPARPTYTSHDIPGGTFYVLTETDRAMAGAGFGVVDDGGVPFFSALAAVGGVEHLGYPVSRRFWQTDSVYQVFEHGVLRWQPATGATSLLPRDGAGIDEGARAPAFRPELPLLLPARAIERYGKPPLIVLDPGHGARETGAIARDEDGQYWTEKHANLDVALHAERLLQALGYQVEMTRRTDAEVAGARLGDVTGDKDIDVREELQARIDFANKLKADLFVSIHFNGSSGNSGRLGGVETYYCEEREYGAENRRIGELLQANIVDALRGTGKIVRDKGLLEDSVLSDPGKHEHLYLLGPTYQWLYRPIGFVQGIKESRIRRPSMMPAALGEASYLTSPTDREQLDQPWVINTIARAYVAAITQYLNGEPGEAAS